MKDIKDMSNNEYIKEMNEYLSSNDSSYKCKEGDALSTARNLQSIREEENKAKGLPYINPNRMFNKWREKNV